MLDKETQLVWANSDNGQDIDWPAAVAYARGFRGGDAEGWRLPTAEEILGLLAGAEEDGVEYVPACDEPSSEAEPSRLTSPEGQRLSCWFLWASNTTGERAAFVGLNVGQWSFIPVNEPGARALPVRSLRAR